MRWRIYYGDTSIYSDASGDPYDAPPDNVQAIASEAACERGFTLCHSKDFYWWTESDGWYGGDLFGLWDWLRQPGPKKVIFARSIPTDEFKAILARAGAEGAG